MRSITGRFTAFLFIALLALIGSIGASGGCATNPVATATKATEENKPETVAFALYATYIVVAEHAATLAENPQTPVTVKERLVQLHGVTSPLAKKLRQAAVEYNAVRDALATGESTPAKVAIALGELNRILNETAPQLQGFAEAVSAADNP